MPLWLARNLQLIFSVLDQPQWLKNTFTQRRGCKNCSHFSPVKKRKQHLKYSVSGCSGGIWPHLIKHPPSSHNVQNCKLTAKRIKPHPKVLCSSDDRVQALGFILSEVKRKKCTYSCCSTLKSITLWVKFAAFASGERWGGSIHAWLLRPSNAWDETTQNLRDSALWNIFFLFFFPPRVLVGCDFNVAGGSEGMSKTPTEDALWQSEKLMQTWTQT